MNNEQMQKITQKHSEKRLSPLKSIRSYCKLMCCVGDLESWKNCTFISCFLYPYRLGVGNRTKKKEQNKKPSSITQLSGSDTQLKLGVRKENENDNLS